MASSVNDSLQTVIDSVLEEYPAAERAAEAVTAGSVTVVDKLEVDDYKTRKMLDVLSALELLGTTVLIVLEDEKPMVEVSVRNIPGVGLVRAEGLNVYEILRHSKMLITKAAIESLQTRLGSRGIGGRES